MQSKERIKDLCSDCGEKVLLEVHYCEPNRISPDGKYSENEGALRLCSDCHRARHTDHNGNYWEDPLEMASHWYTWDYECGDLGDGGRLDNRGSL